MTRQRLLDNFLQYVKVDTTAVESSDRYPSCDGQIELGKLLVKQLQQLGVDEVDQDQHGLVLATIPANVSDQAATVVLNAHLDTSPETSGRNVRPQVIDYSGGDIQLPGNPQAMIRLADNPELHELVGMTLITSDGNTLLGADDKAGVAIIMEVAARLLESPNQFKHGPVRLLFTCDEEIGKGVDYVDIPRLAADVCYTLDGPGAGRIDVETFSADLAEIVVEGINIHPAIAKGRMVNAIKVAASIVAQLPPELSPEVTSGRQGFLHPYTLHGGVAEARLKILLRDFDTSALKTYAQSLTEIVERASNEFPASQIQLNIRPQYRNLGDGLARDPRAVGLAQQAFVQLGLECVQSIIRGGTDGSRFTELGLPAPNLSSGQHNPHSPLEWACLDEMCQAVDVTLEILQLWSKQ